MPFLSHGSALLRARALQMLADGVRVLAAQERTAELYPVLHRAWPLVLARLGVGAAQRSAPPRLRGTGAERVRDALPSEQDANVWLHATRLVGVVGAYASDVFGRPIVEQAWPRWARLLYVLEQLGAARPASRTRIGCCTSSVSRSTGCVAIAHSAPLGNCSPRPTSTSRSAPATAHSTCPSAVCGS